MGDQLVDDGKRYRIKIDGVSWYVILTDVSISVSYAYENREENIKTRTILEKFCTKLSTIMQERNDVREAMGNDSTVGVSSRVESKDSSPKEVCG